MAKNELYWKFFELTGNVEAYILYKNTVESSDNMSLMNTAQHTKSTMQMAKTATVS